MSWIEERISDYYSWLRDSTVIREDRITGWFAVATPFTGQFNDDIEIFVKKDGDDILMSDDGDTLSNLCLSGVDVMRSVKRREYLNKILLDYGVSVDDDGELTVKATVSDFAQKKHALLCAIMEVSDMEVLARDNVTSIFYEDVKAFLDSRGVVYTPDFIARGKSGLDFTFDFQIAGKKEELFIKSFASVKQNSVENFLFGLQDVRQVRAGVSRKGLRSLAIVNDTDAEPQKRLLDALNSYDTGILLWSERDKAGSESLLMVA